MDRLLTVEELQRARARIAALEDTLAATQSRLTVALERCAQLERLSSIRRERWR